MVTDIRMTGMSKNGPCETKQDKIYNLINSLKNANDEFDKETNTRTLMVISCKITNIERKLMELGLTEKQIENFVFS